MLRFDPGPTRVRRARTFEVSEGGGEYNVARAAATTFGLRASVITAIVDNDLGHLLEHLIWAGNVDTSHVIWRTDSGIGADCRVGLNFTERGFGVRAPTSVPDRSNTPASQLLPGDIDWTAIFGIEGARWFHTGGIMAGLSDHAPAVLRDAMAAARSHGVRISYDFNYRHSIWHRRGGHRAAAETAATLMPFVDVLFGGPNDIAAILGHVETRQRSEPHSDASAFEATAGALAAQYPNLQLIAATMRRVVSATVHDWSAVAFSQGSAFESRRWERLEVFDRVGAGDAFAAGVVFAMMTDRTVSEALDLGAAHAALTMTTPGDSPMVSLRDIEHMLAGELRSVR